MSNKDDRIEALEAEIFAARKTIAGLTKAVEELSKKVGYQYHAPIYIQPYRYTNPYWTYTVGDITYTSTVGAGYKFTAGGVSSTTTNAVIINKRDDDDGDAGVRAAV